ncbi:hypothetical protein E2C01_036382 [Portunus trituberculatus]|uniref:Uncharacterized protein n=1 Tax=Portunus trituberculatus TaxID=210409 RepID=A0A5B7F6K0_PORTR|nr:hypothetical protein [Portunus trituberculatus]
MECIHVMVGYVHVAGHYGDLSQPLTAQVEAVLRAADQPREGGWEGREVIKAFEIVGGDEAQKCLTIRAQQFHNTAMKPRGALW